MGGDKRQLLLWGGLARERLPDCPGGRSGPEQRCSGREAGTGTQETSQNPVFSEQRPGLEAATTESVQGEMGLNSGMGQERAQLEWQT